MDKLDFQTEIVERLNISSNNNKLFHSYIFSGAKDSGQLEVAKHFAKLVLAKNDFDAESQIDNLSHANLFHIVSEKQNISKEQVLKMTTEINTTSLTGNSKVFIVSDAHKLSISAQNSLLKVIEEPEGSSFVIFIVENVYQLLPTIVSRSQIVKFKPLPFIHRYYEICDDYDDKLKLKYALYLDDNNFEELYADENFSNYLTIVGKYIKHYFQREDNTYLLEEYCYKNLKSKEEFRNLVNLLIINASSIIDYKEAVSDTIFDDRFLEIINDIEMEQLVELLNKLFKCYEMINSNVNVKLAFDKLTRKDVK